MNNRESERNIFYNNGDYNKVEKEIKLEEIDTDSHTQQQINFTPSLTHTPEKVEHSLIKQNEDNCQHPNNLSSDLYQYKIVERRQKNIESTASQLNEDHICLLKRFLTDTTLLDKRGFLKLLHECKFPRITSMSLRKQLLKWKNLMYVLNDYFSVESSLVIRSSGKCVLPVERYKDTILNAHRREGEFASTHKDHRSYFETKKQFKLKYTLGCSNFGPTVKLMYDVVNSCQDCSVAVKNGASDVVKRGGSDGVKSGTLDSVKRGASDGIKSGALDVIKSGASDVVKSGASDVVKSGASDAVKNGASDVVKSGASDGVKSGASDGVKSGASDGVKTVSAKIKSPLSHFLRSKPKRTPYYKKKVCASKQNLYRDTKFMNNAELNIADIESNNSAFSENLNDSPISMLYQNVKGSMWFNHKGVMQEKDSYKKVIEMIREIGIEVGLAAQGNSKAIDRLSSKIAIVGNILSFFKKSVAGRKIDNERELEDFKIFQELFTAKSRMDLYIYDLNLLARNNATRHLAFLPIPNIPNKVDVAGPNFDEAIEIADFL